jgi:hypothetical protein
MEPFSLSHHATVVRGDRAQAIALIEAQLGIPFSRVPHGDIAYVLREQLSIDDVRELSHTALKRPVLREHFVLIIVADSIGVEAQNALLKLTEDPPPSARFMFILPPSTPLIATLRSRVVEHILHANAEGVTNSFKALSLKDALRDIARATKDKDEAGMERMLTSLELCGKPTAQSVRTSRALMLARRYIEARGASPKMLLEHALITQKELELR